MENLIYFLLEEWNYVEDDGCGDCYLRAYEEDE